jgi:hypothetical protein
VRIRGVALLIAPALVVLTGLWASAPAAAGNVYRDSSVRAGSKTKSVLVLTGVIRPGTFKRFVADISRRKPEMIIVEGPGGRIFESMLIGTEIRRRSIPVLVRANHLCASACAVIFLSARTKLLGAGAKIGVHSAANGHGQRDPSANRLLTSYLQSIGVPDSLVRQVTAVPPGEIRWLTKAELRTLHIQDHR